MGFEALIYSGKEKIQIINRLRLWKCDGLIIFNNQIFK